MIRSDAHRKIIQELLSKDIDIGHRTISCGNGTITLLYIKQLTDRTFLAQNVIKPIVEYCTAVVEPPKAQEAAGAIIYADDCSVEQNENKIEDYVLAGMTVMLFSNDSEYVVLNLKKVQHRSVSDPEISYTQRGPRDCFVENIDVNLSLVRYRLKDKNLHVENIELGERTKTSMAITYIEDIANDVCVQEVKKRLNSINIEGFLESGEVQSFLSNNPFGLFPQMMIIERSDMASEMLLKGKVVILVDGSQLALSAPTTFVEFMYSCDDRYDNKYFGLFMRILRYIAFLISFTASSCWVALVSFHSDIVPAAFIIALAEARTKVPFNALTGALLLEFMTELIRESLLRVPTKIGSAIAIVGALIIGQAAIAAGIFSPLLLIIIAVEFLASFAIPNQAAANPFRLIKILLLLITGMFGFFGLVLGITVIVAELVSVNSFGVPYMAPFGPFNWYDFLRTLLFSKSLSPKRQQYMRDKDDVRLKRK